MYLTDHFYLYLVSHNVSGKILALNFVAVQRFSKFLFIAAEGLLPVVRGNRLIRLKQNRKVNIRKSAVRNPTRRNLTAEYTKISNIPRHYANFNCAITLITNTLRESL